MGIGGEWKALVCAQGVDSNVQKGGVQVLQVGIVFKEDCFVAHLDGIVSMAHANCQSFAICGGVWLAILNNVLDEYVGEREETVWLAHSNKPRVVHC